MQDELSTFKEAQRLYAVGNFGRTIDGSSSSLGKCCGFCNYSLHRGFLTERQRRQHNCLGNSCGFYLPKIQEEKIKTRKKSAPDLDISKELNEAINSYEGIKILKTSENFKGEWEAYYTAISKYDEKLLEKEIEKKCGIKVKLINLNYSFNNAAEIIFKGK